MVQLPVGSSSPQPSALSRSAGFPWELDIGIRYVNPWFEKKTFDICRCATKVQLYCWFLLVACVWFLLVYVWFGSPQVGLELPFPFEDLIRMFFAKVCQNPPFHTTFSFMLAKGLLLAWCGVMAWSLFYCLLFATLFGFAFCFLLLRCAIPTVCWFVVWFIVPAFPSAHPASRPRHPPYPQHRTCRY